MKLKNVFGRPEVDEPTRTATEEQPAPAPVRPQGKVDVAAVTAAIVHQDAGLTDLAQHLALQAETEKEFDHESRTADLKSEAGLQKVTTLLTRRSLLPFRISALEERNTANESSLLATCNAFATDTFGPRGRAAIKRAEEITREKLAQHIADEDALTLAIQKSDNVVSANRISFRASVTQNPLGGLDVHVGRVLEAYSELVTLEKNLGISKAN